MSFRLPVIINYAKTTEPISLNRQNCKKLAYIPYMPLLTKVYFRFVCFRLFQVTVCINVLVFTT